MALPITGGKSWFIASFRNLETLHNSLILQVSYIISHFIQLANYAEKKFSTHIFKLTTNLVTLFLEDYLEILLALILQSGQEIELFFTENFQFLRKEKSEKWKLKFPAEGKTWQNELNRTFLIGFTTYTPTTLTLSILMGAALPWKLIH